MCCFHFFSRTTTEYWDSCIVFIIHDNDVPAEIHDGKWWFSCLCWSFPMLKTGKGCLDYLEKIHKSMLCMQEIGGGKMQPFLSEN